ncbi:hypothetical protein [Methylocystis echinoides]|uniref:Uncharacterized protein n=1 Tax=Methylocystis echinoides TaxID=29468 RepID=A0A9W6GUZ6_9HYPH|nr:hypothetical protein [Methylocystis echinoides]GLI93598.1 hypothetical protein LMG27198_25900 [Methylocystis echinoides]
MKRTLPTTEEARAAVRDAKRFMLSVEGSSVIDERALEIAGKPDKQRAIKQAADEFTAELERQGASELYTRYCWGAFVICLGEKIELAEMGGDPCRSH